jgi:hypothetical protein
VVAASAIVHAALLHAPEIHTDLEIYRRLVAEVGLD